MNPILDIALQTFGLKEVAPTAFERKSFFGSTDELGRTAPMGFAVGGGQAQWLNTSGSALTTDGFTRQGIVYSIVTRITGAAAPLPWFVYKLDAKGQRVAQPAHPLTALLAAPNELQGWPDLCEALLGYLLITGNTYLLREAPAGGLNTGKPNRLRVLPAHLVEVLGGRGYDDPATGYKETLPGGLFRTHAPEDVLHLKFWNPDSARYGLSPVAAGYQQVTAATAGLTARVRSYQNQGPPGILSKKGQGESWGEAGAKQTQSWFRSFLRGGRNQGNVPVVNGDIQWTALGLSPVDLDVLAALQADRDGIADLFAFPGQLLNGSKGTTFSNVAEAKRSFYSTCVVPLLQKVRGRLSPWLTAPYGDGVLLDFDTSQVPELQANQKELAEWLALCPWIPTQTKQRLMGVDEDPALPVYLIPAGLLTLADLTAPAPGDVAPKGLAN